MKKVIKKLLEDLKMSLLNFSFAVIYIICKMSVLLKNHLNCVKNNIFECFFKKYNIYIYIYIFFFKYIMIKNICPEEET